MNDIVKRKKPLRKFLKKQIGNINVKNLKIGIYFKQNWSWIKKLKYQKLKFI